MGNIGRATAQGSLPKYYSYPKTKDMISELNAFCRQNAPQLGFTLSLRGADLQYNHSDWKKSNVPGTVTVLNRSSTDPIQNTWQEEEKKDQGLQRAYSIIMNVKSIFKAHETMKHFQKRLSDSRTVVQTPTGTQHEQCCLCLDKTPTMMLPCFHAYCSNCIQVHIIEQQDKKCPVCRHEFKEDNQSLQKKMIIVIGSEDNIMNDLRGILLEHLRELNSHQVKEVERLLKQPDGQPCTGITQTGSHTKKMIEPRVV